MKEGDKLIIARRSLPVLERLLDNLDAQPETDTANPPVYDITWQERFFGLNQEAN